MKCYHTTHVSRLGSIRRLGLVPYSSPLWFKSPAPYVMLSLEPWEELNGKDSVVLSIEHSGVERWMFDREGLRWPRTIPPDMIKETPR